MKWLEIEVLVKAQDQDVAGLILSELTKRGVEIGSGCANRESRPGLFLTEVVGIKGYLPITAAAEVEELKAALYPFSVGPIRVRELPETDWLLEWRRHYRTFKVGKRLVVSPPWEDYRPEPGELVIVLDPGMAFGCGTHPTTQLCLELLEKAVRPGDVVYDVGTGSGILAIAAAGLGAARVVAVDDDEVAVRVARENVALNGVEDAVTVRRGDLLRDLPEPADVIVANIVADVIISFAPEAAGHLRPGGYFIAGGIAAPREAEVKAALEEHFNVWETLRREEWVAVWSSSPRRSAGE
ncbi:MAG: 50S ribosomal protein L11 methyltransferase [Bacillota bacterium]